MPALNFLPLPRVSHPKPPGQTDGLPTLPGPWGQTGFCLVVNAGLAGGAYGYVEMGPYRGGQAEYLRVQGHGKVVFSSSAVV